MAFVEDFTAFFSTSDFAVTATVGGVSVVGIFDNGYAAALAGALESSAPTFVCATANVVSAVQGTAVTVNSTNYVITTVEPDGTGVSTLVLELA